MSFQTNIVLGKKNKKARVAVAGGVLLVVAVLLSLKDGYERYAMWTFGIAFVLLIGGAIFAKGDLTDIEVSDQLLIIDKQDIRMGDSSYAVGQIQRIDFNVLAYDGMSTNETGIPSGGSSNGMNNYLYFEAGGEKIECRFYLASAEKVQELGILFREWYSMRVPFTERRGVYSTFMFQPMSEKEIEDAKALL